MKFKISHSTNRTGHVAHMRQLKEKTAAGQVIYPVDTFNGSMQAIDKNTLNVTVGANARTGTPANFQ